jgi:PEP-CTERM motif
MKLFSKFALLAAIGASSMFAGTITYNSAPVSFNGVTDFTTDLLLQKFNLADQILTGVEIDYSVSTITSTLSLTNTSTSAQVFRFLSTTDFSATILGGPDALPDTVLTNLNTGFITMAAGAVNIYAPPTITKTGSSSNPGLAPNAFYIGSGFFTLEGDTSSFSSFNGGGGNINVAQATNGTISALVIYTYTAAGVPEPATMTLFGGALLGIGFFARKRSKKV